MKQIYFLFTFLLFSTLLSAQWLSNGSDIYFNTGDVAIGTTATIGAEVFRVEGRSYINGFNINQLSNNTVAFSSVGDLQFSNSVTGKSVSFFARDNIGYNTSFSLDGTQESIVFKTDGSDRLLINKQGSIGIGTITIPTSFKLAVAGDIICEKLKVEGVPNWPDYVFAPDHDLMPLDELSNYIDTHQHLPEVPSAEVVAKNGFYLEEMDATLLRKVEELTLYLLQMQQRVDQQQQQLEVLSQENQKLKKLLEEK